MSFTNGMLGYTTDELREDARHDDGPSMNRRRGVVAVSLAGIASMGLTSLLQMGMVRRLPDPPIRRFETRRVNLSDEAFSYGGPDSPIVILALAPNMAVPCHQGSAGRHQVRLVEVVGKFLACRLPLRRSQGFSANEPSRRAAAAVTPRRLGRRRPRKQE